MGIEVEARFRVIDPSAVVRLSDTARLGNAELGERTAFEETDDYLDTADGALAAARWACRLRQRRGVAIVSLKGPAEAGAGGWMHRRPEVEGPATPDPDPERWPPSDARALLDRLRAGQLLVVRLILRQQRTERAVTVDGAPIGVLSLDDVTVLTPTGEAGRFGIVELELADGSAARQLPPLAATLESLGGLVPEPRSKLERALELLGTGTGSG
jgi:inorganic triphosphatase YgiF